MALLSDREAFDKAAGQKFELDMFKEIMRQAHKVNGFWMLPDTTWERLEMARNAAQRLCKQFRGGVMGSRYAAALAAITEKMEEIERSE